MNLPIILAEIGATTLVVFGIAATLFVFFMFVAIWASRYTKVGPNQVLSCPAANTDRLIPMVTCTRVASASSKAAARSSCPWWKRSTCSHWNC